MKDKFVTACAIGLCLFGSAAAAEFQTYSCAQIDGARLAGGYLLRSEGARERSTAASSRYGVQLQPGDRLSVRHPYEETLEMRVVFPDEMRNDIVKLPWSFTAEQAGIIELSGLQRSSKYEKVAAVSPLSHPEVEATISCTPAGVDAGGPEELAPVSTLNQTGNILRGLRNMRGRDSGAGTRVSSRGLLGFSGDDTSGWRAWGFAEARRFSNAAEGDSFSVTVGADREIGAVRAGVLLSYDKTTLDSGAGDESVEGLAIGPYVTGGTDTFTYDAFVTFSRPDYELTSGDVKGERISYGLQGEGGFAAGSSMLFPYVTLKGAVEDIDGETLRSNQLGAGLRVELASVGDFDPFLSLAYEGTRSESSLTGTTEHGAPRFGLGFDYATDYGAVIGLNIDAGETVEDLRDLGLRLSYRYTY